MFNSGFNLLLLPGLKQVVCSAVTKDYELIDPFGKVYNCTEVPLVPLYNTEYVIGDLNESVTNVKDFVDRPYSDWYDKIRDPSNKFYCTTCKILPVCGGRCPKSWDDGIPACPSMKFNMQDRLILTYINKNSSIPELMA